MSNNPRTETARDHGDRDLIEGMIPQGEADAGSSGGNMARDMGTTDDLTRAVNDPESRERATKQTAIDHAQSRPADRGPNR